MSNTKKTSNEIIKETSEGLRGTISQELGRRTDHFSKEDAQLLKFHGIYEQDDRDLRQQLKKEGKGKKYIFMIRTKIPGGGELTSGQWEALTKVADSYADGTLRITTRQDIQFHGVGKNSLQRAIKHLNDHYVTTYGACGDGNRNIVSSPVSNISKGSVFDGQGLAKRISDSLGFKSKAYYDVWLDGERVRGDEDETETLYGKAYLPRKFKIGIADPDDNSVDVYTHDIGIVPVREGSLEGFNVLVGGGLGTTNRNADTYPRLGTPIARVEDDKMIDVVRRIVEIQRDYGDRSNRKHARLKYLVEEWGVGRFKNELEKRLGYRLDPPLEISLERSEKYLGWHEQVTPGLWYLGIFVENGRIADNGSCGMKTGLLAVTKKYKTGVRLTPSQDIILTNIPAEKIKEVEKDLRHYGIKGDEEHSALRKYAMACPALPTCGLALAEAERFLPSVITELEQMGYDREQVTIRMSGCPNACARSPVAEIGIMGTSPGKYNLYIGGSATGDRLNKLFEENVPGDELPSRIAMLLDLYRERGIGSESFGDFANRVGGEYLRDAIRGTARRDAV
ncbi:MAG: NADPH-dependent assimilatory sulfite reductase hemoprotein subunit [Candidatus Dadabacteria bacterium]|nr:NADPH-dependent assimilatory sulfite reductase hemoprotein subunit [Candidatus Dadabacteria bacterium]